MKVLWYVNIIMPAAAQALGMKVTHAGGWLTGAAEALQGTDVELTVVTVTEWVRQQVLTEDGGISYVLLPSSHYEAAFQQILEQLEPDLVHVFGTEYQYNLQMIHLCCQMDIRHVVSLQGIMYQCAKHYDDGLPECFRKVNPILKLIKKWYYVDCIGLEKQRFFYQGEQEKEMLKTAEAVIGRTAWDKASALEINPGLTYYHVNENLRDPFYTDDCWSYQHCIPHTIFVSQSSYPIKGFHMLLKALPELVKRYPDLKVIVGGQAPHTLHRPRLDKMVDYFYEYQRYTKELIRKNRLESYICYAGPLCAEQMKQQFLNCNVFLSCSTIENSPNSLGEAMILGAPIVASNVGGVESMLKDGEDGFLYDFYDLDNMVREISTLLDSPELAEKMSVSAIAHAKRTHDRAANTKALLDAYECIAKERHKSFCKNSAGKEENNDEL